MIKTLSLALLLLSFSCTSPYSLTRQPSDHHVIIFTGTESRTPLDPVDKNVFLIEAASIYSSYIQRGVPPANIHILYHQSAPDWQEPFLLNIPASFRAEFNAAYDNAATVVNLMKIEDKVDDKLDEKSVLHLVMNGHGHVDAAGFYMHSEEDERFIRKDLLTDMVEDNKGMTHLFVASCYSGSLLDEIDAGVDILVTGANATGSSWLDRDNSFGRLYFSQLPANLDPAEYTNSYTKARADYKKWGANRSFFIFNHYKTNRKDELKTIVWEPLYKRLTY